MARTQPASMGTFVAEPSAPLLSWLDKPLKADSAATLNTVEASAVARNSPAKVSALEYCCWLLAGGR